MDKKKVVAFTIADDNNLPMAKQMINSLRKFHSEEELPVIIIGEEEIKEYNDPHFFYRATPIIAKKLITEYDLVLKLDADQIIMGSLDYIINPKSDWEVGVVLNWNRVDTAVFGEVGVFNITPHNYFNAGLVAMRSGAFVDHWYKLCFGPYFGGFRYREQDLMNIALHYGPYEFICFDVPDVTRDYVAWHGLICKGEGLRMYVKDGEVYLDPKDGYPNETKKIKVYHYAGGGHQPRNHRIYFNEEMIAHIDYLISDGK